MVQGTLAYCLPRQISFSAPISSVRGGIGRPLSFVSSFAGKIAAAHFCAVPARCREPGRVLTASRAPGGRPPADGPSMLIDIEDGRPTEGEHTIGDLMERASCRGVSTPILSAALCNLQAYEINRGNSR